MMSESFVNNKLAELEQLDINNSSIGYELQRFYGIIEVLNTEAYEEGIKLHGVPRFQYRRINLRLTGLPLAVNNTVCCR